MTMPIFQKEKAAFRSSVTDSLWTPCLRNCSWTGLVLLWAFFWFHKETEISFFFERKRKSGKQMSLSLSFKNAAAESCHSFQQSSCRYGCLAPVKYTLYHLFSYYSDTKMMTLELIPDSMQNLYASDSFGQQKLYGFHMVFWLIKTEQSCSQRSCSAIPKIDFTNVFPKFLNSIS